MTPEETMNELLKRTINFYAQGPDGQYDEIAYLCCQFAALSLADCVEQEELIERLRAQLYAIPLEGRRNW